MLLAVPRKVKPLASGRSVTSSDKAGGLGQTCVLTAVSKKRPGYLAGRGVGKRVFLCVT